MQEAKETIKVFQIILQQQTITLVNKTHKLFHISEMVHLEIWLKTYIALNESIT